MSLKVAQWAKQVEAAGGVDVDGKYGDQCWDLSADWAIKNGAPYLSTNGTGGARGIYSKANTASHTLVPSWKDAREGDIFVTGATVSNSWGHTGVVLSVNPNGSLNTLEQNVDPPYDGSGPVRRIVRSSFSNFLGFARPKNYKVTGDNDMIGKEENWYGRLNKLHFQVRGVPLSRTVFKAFEGKSVLSFIEAVSDDKQADEWTNKANAYNSLKEGNRIKDASIKELTKELAQTKAQLKEAAAQAEKAAQKVVEAPSQDEKETTKKVYKKIAGVLNRLGE